MEDLNLLQMASAAEPATTTVEIRKNGDAVLVVSHKRFVVSKEILQVTSDYFKALFSPLFREGQVGPTGQHPEVILYGDDPDAMGIILSILHHHLPDTQQFLAPAALLKIAQHCDKYQCQAPLQPWASQWIQAALESETETEPDYSSLLVAAYIFRCGKSLKEISKLAIRHLHLSSGMVKFDAELKMPDIIQGLFLPLKFGLLVLQ